MASDAITIRRPDDWHVHLRDGAMLAAVAPLTARQFARAIVMPNLLPPVTTPAAAAAYRRRILAVLPEDAPFVPMMTCYLTDGADAEGIVRGFRDGTFAAVKLYPAHATTHSAHGVTDLRRVASVLGRMEEVGMPLLVHGEATDPDVDVFDRESVFVERTLAPLGRDFPALRIVLEHVTTEEGTAFVRAHANRMAATITAHHLVMNRNALLVGGIRPHHYCLPVPKRERHRRALLAAATSGEACFFLGTDSAPHSVADKESACGCAGVFTAVSALELYAQVFEDEEKLANFEAFAALNGARFYGLAVNEGTVTLVREDWRVPDRIAVAGGTDVRPFLGGETLRWRLAA